MVVVFSGVEMTDLVELVKMVKATRLAAVVSVGKLTDYWLQSMW